MTTKTTTETTTETTTTKTTTETTTTKTTKTTLSLDTARMIGQYGTPSFIGAVIADCMALPHSAKNDAIIAVLRKRLFELDLVPLTEALTAATTATAEPPTEEPLTRLSPETVKLIIATQPTQEATVALIGSLNPWRDAHQVCLLQTYLFSLDPEMEPVIRLKPEPEPKRSLWTKLQSAIKKKKPADRS